MVQYAVDGAYERRGGGGGGGGGETVIRKL